MTETELAWCGNSVYHDECDQGVYDDRCGSCRRMFERLSAHQLEAVGTLQTALRGLREPLRQWDEHGAADPAYRGMELAEAVRASLRDVTAAALHGPEERVALQTALRQLHRYSSDDMRIRHRQVVLLADLLALLPALEPTP